MDSISNQAHENFKVLGNSQNLKKLNAIRAKYLIHKNIENSIEFNKNCSETFRNGKPMLPLSAIYKSTSISQLPGSNNVICQNLDLKQNRKYFLSQQSTLIGNSCKISKRILFTARHGLKLPKEVQSITQKKPMENYSLKSLCNSKRFILSQNEVSPKKHLIIHKHTDGIVIKKDLEKVCSIRNIKTANVNIRPESRYNKSSLFCLLENGRSKNCEYNVPVIQMKLKEYQSQNELLPKSWQKDEHHK